MIANTKTITFLLVSILSVIAMTNGQAVSVKTPSPSTIPVATTMAPIMAPKGSRSPTIFDHFGSGKAGKGSKLSKKTRSPEHKASKLVSSTTGKGTSGKGKGGKAGKGMTYSPVASLP
ncbi:unnamed protein product [Cylindrotheca closterium]|uniref:Uncharacterized protein n=1 Tax=Cylindrotheca closterium TaxID=2856 RepID=A0AAD2CIY6_9STRA|nr:unnamed protein product [Cylindrotheca closterium]